MKKALAQSQVLIVAAAMSLFSGCAPMSPRLDSSFGHSLNSLRAMQTIEPDASGKPANALLDGRTSKDVLDRYRESYKTPAPQQNVFTIGVGNR